MPEDFTNRELYMLIKNNAETNQLQHEAIRQSLLDFHETTNKILDTILAQTTKTNGRVTGLEAWRSYIAGGIALFCLVGLPMLWMMYNDVKQDAKDLQAHIVETK